MVGVVSASALGSKNVRVKLQGTLSVSVVRSSEASASRRFLANNSSTVVSTRSFVLVRFSEVLGGSVTEALLYLLHANWSNIIEH